MNSKAKSDYLAIQRSFWNVDEQTARFGRVDTVSRSQQEYDQLADRDVEFVLEGVAVQPGWTLLEVGCGVGRLISRIAANIGVVKIIGVDIAENMIQFARKSLTDQRNIEFHVNTGADLSMLGDSSVHFAYSNDVFIHIADIEVVRSYFAELYRVLRPGGIFRFNVRRMDLETMFSTSVGGRLAKAGYHTGLLSPLRGRKAGNEGFNGIQYREKDLRKLLKATGLDVVSLHSFDGIDERKFWCTCRKNG